MGFESPHLPFEFTGQHGKECAYQTLQSINIGVQTTILLMLGGGAKSGDGVKIHLRMIG